MVIEIGQKDIEIQPGYVGKYDELLVLVIIQLAIACIPFSAESLSCSTPCSE